MNSTFVKHGIQLEFFTEIEYAGFPKVAAPLDMSGNFRACPITSASTGLKVKLKV